LSEAGIVPLSGLSDTLDELTDAQLVEGRNFARALVQLAPAFAGAIESALGHDGGFGALKELLGRPEQWQTRALLVVCLAALLRVNAGQNRTRLENVLKALGNQ